MGLASSVEDHVNGELAEDLAAAAIRTADALLITTGAGMGVDSGLGTFRGKAAGVWPPLKAMQLDFSKMSSPRWFELDPRLAWAFWKYRYEAYVKSTPHEGYSIAAKWGGSRKFGLFSVTSNIDGHWERTPGVGEARVYECHGTVQYIHRMELDDEMRAEREESAQEEAEAQRPNLRDWRGRGRLHPTDGGAIAAMQVPEWVLEPGQAVEVQLADKDATGGIKWTGYVARDTDTWVPAVVGEDACSVFDQDGTALEAKALRKGPGEPDLFRVSESCPLPVMPRGHPARPAVLMFADGGVCKDRIRAQEDVWLEWRAALPHDARLVILEIGAGVAIQTVRITSETAAEEFPNSVLIRINCEHSGVPPELAARSCSIERGALDALRALDLAVGPASVAPAAGKAKAKANVGAGNKAKAKSS